MNNRNLKDLIRTQGIINLCKDYYKQNKKKCLEIGLVVIIVIAIIIIIAARGTERRISSESLSAKAEKVVISMNTNEDINTLIKTYFDCLISGDSAHLEELMLLPEGESLSIEQQSLIAEYPVIDCYVADGIDKSEYAVYVYWQAKINGTKVLVPGAQAFYVIYDEEADCYKIMTDISSNETISTYISYLAGREEIAALIDTTNDEFEAALVSDDSLRALFDTLYNTYGLTEGAAAQESSEEETSEEQGTTEEESTTEQESTEKETKAKNNK